MLSYQYNNVAHRCRWMDEGAVVSSIQPKVMPETVRGLQVPGQNGNEQLSDLRVLRACRSVCPGCPVSCTVFRHELAQEAGLCPRQGARRANGGAERARPHPPHQNIAICCSLGCALRVDWPSCETKAQVTTLSLGRVFCGSVSNCNLSKSF